MKLPRLIPLQSHVENDIVIPEEFGLVLGRNKFGLKGTELSRKQVELKNKNGQVSIVLTGLNPSLIIRNDEMIELKKNEPFPMESGDVLSLLPDQQSTFRLVIPVDHEEQNGETKKRLREKEESHEKKSVHWKDSIESYEKKEKLSEEQASFMKQMKEIFPTKHDEEIEHALESVGWKMDEAIEFILKPESTKEIKRETEENPPKKEESPSKKPKLDRTDSDIARTLQQAYDEAQKLEIQKRKAEEEAKTQEEIIKIILKEKEAAEKKSMELSRISQDIDKLYLAGEKEAMEGTTVKKFLLKPERAFETDAASIHFRTAESQFHRLLSAGASYKVTSVEYVVNPTLMKRFEERRLKLAELCEWEDTKPILAFHGTDEKNIDSIITNNFDLSKVSSNTHNYGWYGRGIYFSEHPDYSMGYVRNCSKILLCQILLGRCYVTDICEGSLCKSGFDSHISSCGNEIVIFDQDSILPYYVVHYVQSHQGFF